MWIVATERRIAEWVCCLAQSINLLLLRCADEEARVEEEARGEWHGGGHVTMVARLMEEKLCCCWLKLNGGLVGEVAK